MITIFQILGMIIPAFIMVIVFLHACKNVNEGKELDPIDSWELSLFIFMVFVLGFTIGTII